MSYISTLLYNKVINHAIDEGLSYDDLKDLSTSIFDAKRLKVVPSDHFFELHELVDSKLGPGFSVRVGQQMKIEDYGVLGLSWKTCTYAGEIFVRSERYFKLLSDTYLFKVEDKDSESVVRLLRVPHRRGVELSNESTLSATVVVIQSLTGKNIYPIKVCFQHKAPENIADYSNAFRTELCFQQSEYSITYKKDDLQLPTIKADESINRFLLERVKEEEQGIVLSKTSIIVDVEQIIKDALPSGIPTLNKVGQLLGMSSRTLARRLSENGVTFRDLIKRKQKYIAEKSLKDPSKSIAEIAYETGFLEQSSFNRAFKNWTGISPLVFRKKNARY